MGRPEAVFRKQVIYAVGLKAHELAGRLARMAIRCTYIEDGELELAFDPQDVPNQPGDPLLVNMPEDWFIDIASGIEDLSVELNIFANKIKELMGEFW